MNYFLTFAILTIFALNCDAGTVSENSLDPDLPGMCFYNEEYYEPGEHQLPGCTRLVCSPRGWASVHTCKETGIKKCNRGDVIDGSQPFPECCKRMYTCFRRNGSRYTMINF